MTELENNMRIYESARTVPEEAQKQFDNGSFKGTDINPMWRIKKLTELFGPCGIGWYYEIVSERAEEHGDHTMAIVDINLYIKVDGEWSKPIYGTGGNSLKKPTSKGVKTSDEGYKMALTDALSVAAKALGVGADIYFSKDKTKYTDNQKDEPNTRQSDDAAPPMICENCLTEIRPYRYNGKVTSAYDVAHGSYEKFGKILCASCSRALAAAQSTDAERAETA